MHKKIGILTTFGDFDDGYSLCNVVRNQIFMLKNNGYDPELITLDCFPKEKAPLNVKLRAVLPTTTFEPYQGIAQHRNVPSSFERDVARITPVYDEHFKDFNVLLAHDIIFQDSFLAYNAALYKRVPLQNFWMYHWIHSGPSARLDVGEPISYLYNLPPQSTLVYMNSYDTIRAAEMYNTFAAKGVRVVHNPIDYRTARDNHQITNELISDFSLNDADIIAVYPLSTTRMGKGGKQLHKAIKIMGNLKKLGKVVRLIVPNAHANGENEKHAMREMLVFAHTMGLTNREVIFTSLLSKELEGGVPHKVVIDLFTISDVFLFPSVSENCPLALLEAAMGKNLMVLNEDFTPIKDFVGSNALYFKFDSVSTVTTHVSEEAYYFDVARIIWSELKENKTYLANVDIRKKFNVDAIFKNELEPLFFQQHGQPNEL